MRSDHDGYSRAQRKAGRSAGSGSGRSCHQAGQSQPSILGVAAAGCKKNQAQPRLLPRFVRHCTGGPLDGVGLANETTSDGNDSLGRTSSTTNGRSRVSAVTLLDRPFSQIRTAALTAIGSFIFCAAMLAASILARPEQRAWNIARIVALALGTWSCCEAWRRWRALSG